MLTEPISLLLNGPCSDSIWTDVLIVLGNVINDSETQLKSKLSGLGVDQSLINSSVSKMKFQAWQRLLRVIKEEITDLSIHEKLRRW